jgi:porphobilinogen synthase
LRKNETLRRLVRETKVSVDNLIMPYFVCEGRSIKNSVKSMPGVNQLSIDNLLKEASVCKNLGIPAILLFGIPKKKDLLGSSAYNKDGIIQRTIRAIKDKRIDILVITDVCLCEYTSHGHCGVVETDSVNNDKTLELLAKTALSHTQAGVDMVAPSSMMDGQVKAIRTVLDKNGFTDIPIMAYSAKFVSNFYGPFREAAESAPSFGDRKSYQMNFSNSEEALREVALDIKEGVDIVMVKPGLGYQDIIYRVKKEFHWPLAVYNVSGEYAMIKAATQKGWLDEKKTVLEIITGFKRAGADIIITYWAKDIAAWLNV